MYKLHVARRFHGQVVGGEKMGWRRKLEGRELVVGLLGREVGLGREVVIEAGGRSDFAKG